jgi:hypothetical protein
VQLFLNEYPKAKKGFIICQTPHPMKMTENIDALPWSLLTQILETERSFDPQK